MATYTTFALAEAAYLASTDYDDGSGSVSKAKTLRSAIRALMHLSPTSASQQGAGYSKESLKSELDTVTAWLAANDSTAGGTTTLADFRCSRRG